MAYPVFPDWALVSSMNAPAPGSFLFSVAYLSFFLLLLTGKKVKVLVT